MKRSSPQGQKGTSSGVSPAIKTISMDPPQYTGSIARNGSWEIHALDVAQRHLQEAGPEIAEGRRVAGAEEPVGALLVAGFRQSRLRQHPLRAGRDRVSGGHQPDVPPQE